MNTLISVTCVFALIALLFVALSSIIGVIVVGGAQNVSPRDISMRAAALGGVFFLVCGGISFCATAYYDFDEQRAREAVKK